VTIINPEAATARGGVRTIRPVLAATVLTLALAGCQNVRETYTAPVSAIPADYRANHPITIQEGLATFDIPVGRETPYLAGGMEGNVLAFAGGFMSSGSGALAIVLPTGTPNAANAASIASQVEGVLVAGGVPQGVIEYRTYPGGSNMATAPVRLAYVRLGATTNQCGLWPDNLATNIDVNYANFGCATQQNLAAMVANPLDLLYPRLMTPPSAARRSNVLDAYQAGQATATEYPQTTNNTGAAP
jgi:pilus assembly protein CpaD